MPRLHLRPVVRHEAVLQPTDMCERCLIDTLASSEHGRSQVSVGGKWETGAEHLRQPEVFGVFHSPFPSPWYNPKVEYSNKNGRTNKYEYRTGD
jgi:hypothetical protein